MDQVIKNTSLTNAKKINQLFSWLHETCNRIRLLDQDNAFKVIALQTADILNYQRSIITNDTGKILTISTGNTQPTKNASIERKVLEAVIHYKKSGSFESQEIKPLETHFLNSAIVQLNCPISQKTYYWIIEFHAQENNKWLSTFSFIADHYSSCILHIESNKKTIRSSTWKKKAVLPLLLGALITIGFIPVEYNAISRFTVQPTKVENLFMPISGAIETKVDDLRFLKKDDVIFALNSDDLEVKKLEYEKNIASVTTKISLAKDEASTIDEARELTELKLLEIDLETENILLNKAKLDINKCTVLAPYDCQVSYEGSDFNQNALAKTNTGREGKFICTLTPLDPEHQLEIFIDETDYNILREHKSCRIFFSSAPDQDYHIKIKQIDQRPKFDSGRYFYSATSEKIDSFIIDSKALNGATGFAILNAGHVTLAYSIFRKSITALRGY
jgi:hypothetical protein